MSGYAWVMGFTAGAAKGESKVLCNYKKILDMVTFVVIVV